MCVAIGRGTSRPPLPEILWVQKKKKRKSKRCIVNFMNSKKQSWVVFSPGFVCGTVTLRRSKSGIPAFSTILVAFRKLAGPWCVRGTGIVIALSEHQNYKIWALYMLTCLLRRKKKTYPEDKNQLIYKWGWRRLSGFREEKETGFFTQNTDFYFTLILRVLMAWLSQLQPEATITDYP